MKLYLTVALKKCHFLVMVTATLLRFFFVLDKVLNGNNAVLRQSLIILKNQDIPDRNILLRQLVVEEWPGTYSNEYACFLTIALRNLHLQTMKIHSDSLSELLLLVGTLTFHPMKN